LVEEVALEGFQGGEFRVLGCEGGYVGEKGVGSCGMLKGEGREVGLERRGGPVG